LAENWIRIDEVEDVAGAIRHAIRSAQFVQEDALSWKWVVLALHSALQGACVCHLTTTAEPVGAVNKRNAREWLEYYEKSLTDPNARPPKTELMAFPELLRAIREPHAAGDGSNPIEITISDSELNWLCRFHKTIRNQFVHFEPMGWSIEVSGVPGIAKLMARIIGEIIEHGWAFRHLDLNQLEELKRNLLTLRSEEWLASPQKD